MRNTRMKAMRPVVFLLCAGLLLIGGCKDLFHPGGPTKPAEFTVTFNAGGGKPTVETRTVTSGESVGASNMPSDPARDGYIFDGWYTAVDGDGTQFTAAVTVTGNITVYARWTAVSASVYTVTFNADGGSPAAQTRTAASGASIGSANMPTEPTKSGYTFDGWYTAGNGGGTQFTAATTVTADITVYAKWTVIVPAASLQAALAWLDSNAVEDGVYTITVTNNETIAPKTLSYGGKNVSVTITGGSTKRTVSLNNAGSLFTVEDGVTLTLDNNLALRGRSDNTVALVSVESGGTLVMNTGAEISDNTASSNGGGVYVTGTFTMNGGIISGNTTTSYPSAKGGGGVLVQESGTFTMSGGEISDNTADFGGGVYAAGTFTMNGGEISDNTASSSSSNSSGGGVYAPYASGAFTMNGGEISGNEASSSSESSSSSGGGVYAATFTMNGGEISGNTVTSISSSYPSPPRSSSKGGGVAAGTFIMSGGEISGNTASSSYSAYSPSPYSFGGGVYADTFIKQGGGVIHGSDASGRLKNAAAEGHAIYVPGSSVKKRDTTAGSGVTMDSAASGVAGGWE
jgi:uncharacterized repeat protein (TIGR02543 family)